MVFLSLLIVLTCYSFYTAIIYSDIQAKHAIPIGLGLAVIGNLIWLVMSKIILDNKVSILYYGLAFDAVVTISTILVPVLFFGVRLSSFAWCGVGLTLLGLFILKFTGE